MLLGHDVPMVVVQHFLAEPVVVVVRSKVAVAQESAFPATSVHTSTPLTVLGAVVQKLNPNFDEALNASAPPTTAKSTIDINITFTLFITIGAF